MRSHPHTPPPALPPLLSDLSAYLQTGDRKPSRGHEVPSSTEPDPDTSRLLPPPQHRPHRVRVQGQLAVVRSVSVANLKSAEALRLARDGDARRSGSGQRRGGRRRRRSLDNDESESDAEDREVAARDRQLRGYGIGGAGNIRRPTDVMGGPSRTSGSLSRLFARPGSTSSGSPSATATTTPLTPGSERKRWGRSIEGFLNRVGDRKRRGIPKPAHPPETSP
ncbi:hypothetical protein F5X96DRAFT_220033 [Biscogniauxia mediterranea]|nr:hypothetical protein F5X96DRAFT_220033 [Biscogniauxia mediterranea]